MVLSWGQVHDAGELLGAPAAPVLVVPHVFVAPSTRTPAKRDGLSAAAVRTAWMWDRTVFHARYQLAGQPTGGGSFEAQLTGGPADRPGAQQGARGAHLPVLLGEGYPFRRCSPGTSSGVRAIGSVSAPPPRARRPLPPPPAHDSGRSHRTQDTRQPGRRIQHPTPDPTRAARPRSGGNPPTRRAVHTDHSDQAKRSRGK